MKKLVFATHNANKAKEIAAILPDDYEVLTLDDIDFLDDIPETADTLQGNALIKARTIFEKTGLNCFADDTGLEVYALGNAPGVHSARYAGEQRSDDQNISKLLQELDNKSDRKARFRTVIALLLDGKEFLFEGIVEGEIRREATGNNGFGYDPVFSPENEKKTFAEMTLEKKNKMSHRARAFKKLTEFLSK